MHKETGDTRRPSPLYDGVVVWTQVMARTDSEFES